MMGLENNKGLQEILSQAKSIITDVKESENDLLYKKLKRLESFGLVKSEWWHYPAPEDMSIGGRMMVGSPGSELVYKTTKLGDTIYKILNSDLKNSGLENWLKFISNLERSFGEERRFDLTSKKGILLYLRLKRRYSQPHRVYHTLGHIVYCLNEFEPVRDNCKYPNEVGMAIWFHDTVYDPKADNNEKRSAELANKLLKEIGLPNKFRKRVTDFILVTKYNGIPQDFDARILMDIDLSIFGKSNQEFEEYERNIRKEQGWMTEEQFRIKRAALLQKFLNRSHIYQTKYFRQKYELRARKNLESALRNLEV